MKTPLFILAMAVSAALFGTGLWIFIYDPGAITGGRWMDADSGERYALTSLSKLSRESPAVYDWVMTHPEVADGITGDEPLILALIADIGINNPGLVDSLLDPSIRQPEKRDITLPLRGDVQIFVVRLKPGSARTMDYLEDAVRFAEGYMGEQFPTKLVLLLVADVFDYGTAGHYNHINMAVHPDFDSESGWERDRASSVLTHEVAHYYWNGNASDWLDEGPAEIMEVIHEESRSGYRATISDSGRACPLPSLRALESMEDRAPVDCAYTLGGGLFRDLYYSLGSDDFRRGFRDLYRASRDVPWLEDPKALTVEDLRNAFSFSDEATEKVIPKWYGE